MSRLRYSPKHNAVGQLYGNGMKDKIMRILNPLGLTESVFPGELHAKSYNFLGPGTNLEAREKAGPKYSQPINQLDAAAKKHDYAYKVTSDRKKNGVIIREKAIDEIHAADDEFINDLKNIPGFDVTKAIAAKAILLKQFAEKSGLLNPAEFSGTGLSSLGKMQLGTLYKFDPAHKLKKEMSVGRGKKRQVGGFAVLPFLVPIITSLAAEGISRLVTHFTQGKQSGSGIPRDLDGMRKFIVGKLDDMEPETQMDTVISAFPKTRSV